MRLHTPIIRTASAAVAAYLLIVLVHAGEIRSLPFSLALPAWFLAGLVYTQLVEYWYHRVPMHRGLGLLDDVKRNHLEHHGVFYGSSFRTRREEHLGHIVGRWWVFPILFFAHYGILSLVLSTGAALFFLLGALFHYLAFEISHWFTHLEDNAFDRALAQIPVLGKLRAQQIEHHRIHHEVPEVAFNFNAPYLGDRLSGRMPRDAPGFGLALPGTAALEDRSRESDSAPFPAFGAFPEASRFRRAWSRPLVRYGSALAAGVAILGLAMLAHGWRSHDKLSASSEEVRF